jgi:hypothetical protein
MPRQALTLGDARSFRGAARKTAALRGLLALLVVALVALAYLSFSRRAGAAALADGRGSTVAVIDLSGSISDPGFRTIRAELERLIHGGGRVGLVFFSDVAEEALPPGTAAAELGPFAQALEPEPLRTMRDGSVASTNPWSTTFSGGTDISTGLAAARKALDRAGGGRVLLLSDLADGPEDGQPLRNELLAYARDRHVRLEVVPLPGVVPSDQAVYRRFLGPVIAPSVSSRVAPDDAHAPPWRLLAVLGGLALVLAAAELLAAPLAWRTSE